MVSRPRAVDDNQVGAFPQLARHLIEQRMTVRPREIGDHRDPLQIRFRAGKCSALHQRVRPLLGGREPGVAADQAEEQPEVQCNGGVARRVGGQPHEEVRGEHTLHAYADAPLQTSSPPQHPHGAGEQPERPHDERHVGQQAQKPVHDQQSKVVVVRRLTTQLEARRIEALPKDDVERTGLSQAVPVGLPD